MPTLSRSAVPIDQDFFGPIEIDNQTVENIRASWYPYTMPFNLTGNPAISLPCGFDAAGMPLAIQLVARPGEDAALLRVAAAFEQARPWAQRAAGHCRVIRCESGIKGFHFPPAGQSRLAIEPTGWASSAGPVPPQGWMFSQRSREEYKLHEEGSPVAVSYGTDPGAGRKAL